MSANDLHLRTTATPVLTLSGAAVTSDDHWLVGAGGNHPS
jgi:hypothetical protein